MGIKIQAVVDSYDNGAKNTSYSLKIEKTDSAGVQPQAMLTFMKDNKEAGHVRVPFEVLMEAIKKVEEK